MADTINQHDLFTRLMAAKLGMSEDEMNAQDKIHQDAINAGAMGAIGRIAMVPGSRATAEAAEAAMATQPEMTLAERLKRAAMDTEVQTPDGAFTDGKSMYQGGSNFQRSATERFNMMKKALQGK
jgi:hypothetical protein